VHRIAVGGIPQPMVVGVVAYGRHHIVLVPIDDMEPMPLGLIWYTSYENAHVESFVRMAQSFAGAG
jgi:hypothetical protein